MELNWTGLKCVVHASGMPDLLALEVFKMEILIALSTPPFHTSKVLPRSDLIYYGPKLNKYQILK